LAKLLVDESTSIRVSVHSFELDVSELTGAFLAEAKGGTCEHLVVFIEDVEAVVGLDDGSSKPDIVDLAQDRPPILGHGVWATSEVCGEFHLDSANLVVLSRHEENDAWGFEVCVDDVLAGLAFFPLHDQAFGRECGGGGEKEQGKQ
jgi:hypothetical protein